MELVETVFLLLLIIFIGVLVACGLFLVKNAIASKTTPLLHLGIFFLFLVGFFVVSAIRGAGIPISYMVDFITIQGTIITGFFFMVRTFSIEKPVFLKASLFIFVVLGIFNLIFTVLQDLAISFEGGRLGRTLASALQIIIVSSWQAGLALRDYRTVSRSPVTPYVKRRYLMFGVASLLAGTLAVIDIISTALDVYLYVGYLIAQTLIVILMMGYCMINFIIWVTPSWFYRSRGNQQDITEHAKLETSYRDTFERKDNLDPLPRTQVMNVIEFFGEWLGTRLRKSPSACKGLILISLQDELPQENMLMIKQEQFLRVFKNGLKSRMKLLKIEDVDTVIDDLLAYASTNKSIFSLANI